MPVPASSIQDLRKKQIVPCFTPPQPLSKALAAFLGERLFSLLYREEVSGIRLLVTANQIMRQFCYSCSIVVTLKSGVPDCALWLNSQLSTGAASAGT